MGNPYHVGGPPGATSEDIVNYSISESEGKLKFVDLFAGAGGLSLGLMQAGLRGIFAVEQEANAFATLRANLIDEGGEYRYLWPSWLPIAPLSIDTLLSLYSDRLLELRGEVDVLAGGPPCQGFSSAGLRRQNDPRNRLFEQYAQVAELLRPRLLVFENVPWIAVAFDKQRRRDRNPRGLGRPAKAFSDRVSERLAKAGYEMTGLIERAAEFGVPQNRTRFLMVGIRTDLGTTPDAEELRCRLAEARDNLLAGYGLDWPVSLGEAISDLETAGRRRQPCDDSPLFEQAEFRGPRTRYQQLMHAGMPPDTAPNSMRLANQRAETVQRLRRILTYCRKGVRVTPAQLDQLGTGKASITPLSPDQPSHTLTSLPDDFVHYSEPRILTVREYARIQAFPDWFAFQGKYTTGGKKRRVEVPRYTQVANAVPPLLAEVLGRALQQLAGELGTQGVATTPALTRQTESVPAPRR